MQLRARQRGDTIIEVMLAFTVFAMLAVGAMTIMNQGIASAQQALETTLVRQQVDGQAEALRFMYQSYASNPGSPTRPSANSYSKVLETKVRRNDASKFDSQTCSAQIPNEVDTDGTKNKSFLINPTTASLIDQEGLKSVNDDNSPAYAQIVYDDNDTMDTSDDIATPFGLWIEAVKGDSEPEFVDFHIRACWDSTTSDVARTLGTIVRLYTPTDEAGQLYGVGTAIPEVESYSLTGSQYEPGACRSHLKGENEESEPLPANLFLTGVLAAGCTTIGGTNSVYSCSNYDVQYDPRVATSASYSLTLTYRDYLCGGSTSETMPNSYGYKVAVYVDGNLRAQEVLSSTSSSFRFNNIGVVGTASKVQIRWWNNHWVEPGHRDPDFTIDRVRLDRIY